MTGLVEIYDNYIAKAKAVRKKASPFAGIFGLGDDPRKHPCHEEFYEIAEQWVSEFSTHDPKLTLEVVQFIFQAPLDHQDNRDVNWFLLAAHGLTLSLIPTLDPADRKALVDWYEEHYPKRVRFPIHNQVLKCLKTGKRP